MIMLSFPCIPNVGAIDDAFNIFENILGYHMEHHEWLCSATLQQLGNLYARVGWWNQIWLAQTEGSQFLMFMGKREPK
ncbi:uncharacterized protein HKW66_Vig0023660 [Vigna angularis]|uniref:Uncharacterized protein n=1 Tax=Phaseolus angularis TaxID=3914 RepID=A0A8T0L6H4_PHAAN|nr:uncharacterized protein HKW66_Vig0023660 [Vigna angularis]